MSPVAGEKAPPIFELHLMQFTGFEFGGKGQLDKERCLYMNAMIGPEKTLLILRLWKQWDETDCAVSSRLTISRNAHGFGLIDLPRRGVSSEWLTVWASAEKTYPSCQRSMKEMSLTRTWWHQRDSERFLVFDSHCVRVLISTFPLTNSRGQLKWSNLISTTLKLASWDNFRQRNFYLKAVMWIARGIE